MGTLDHIEDRWLDVDGLRIYCRLSEGTGPALVLLQGSMLDSSMLTWKRVLEALPPHYRVFAPDLPGYGRSETPEAASFTTAYFVRFLEHLLDVLGLERASIFGSSMSGAVALGFALRCPERVERLVLAGAYGFQRRLPLHGLAYLTVQIPHLARLVRRTLHLHPLVMRLGLRLAVHQGRHITKELVDDAYAGLRGEEALEAFVQWMRSEVSPWGVRSCFLDALPRLPMPVLLLHGRHDWMMPARHARRAARRFPNASLRVFPECGHLVPREASDLVDDLIVRFLERTPPYRPMRQAEQETAGRG